jgi:hypothetical protein
MGAAASNVVGAGRTRPKVWESIRCNGALCTRALITSRYGRDSAKPAAVEPRRHSAKSLGGKMDVSDFIDEKEIMAITGWSERTMRNVRYNDHSHPKVCKGKIKRWNRKEWFAWYQNRDTQKKSA